jgi:hypothetical protein
MALFSTCFSSSIVHEILFKSLSNSNNRIHETLEYETKKVENNENEEYIPKLTFIVFLQDYVRYKLYKRSIMIAKDVIRWYFYSYKLKKIIKELKTLNRMGKNNIVLSSRLYKT